MKKLWYKQPAGCWNEAMPLGNGGLGAMVYGHPCEETVGLNEESVWSAPWQDRNNPDAARFTDEIRNLLAAGETERAQDLTRYSRTGIGRNEAAYQTAGCIALKTKHRGWEEYTRELSLEDAVATVSYRQGDVQYKRTCFVSAPDNVLALRFTASKPGSVSLDATLHRGDCKLDNLSALPPLEEDAVSMWGGSGVKFCIWMKAAHRGGSLERIGQFLVAEGCDEVTLYLAISTSYRCGDYAEQARETAGRAAEKGFDALLKAHVRDYRGYFDRMSLSLGEESPGLSALPTDERLTRVKEGKEDLGLMASYFDFGRYLLISSSRPGTLPANLQGIWNEHIDPPWGSKYTININTEMNYWPAEGCGLSDCHLPLFALLRRMKPHGEKTARSMYGCRGFVAHHNTDMWGDTAPQDLYLPATYWMMGAAWLCTHVWQHYEYTQDLGFLREHYDLLRDAALFFVDYLTEDDKGRLIVSPTVSPENQYRHPVTGLPSYFSAGCTMDSQILRDLFSAFLEASALLGEKELTGEAGRVLARLPRTEIHSNGTIREWTEEYEEIEVGHRHISHLYGLYPSCQITPEKTPELAKAAGATLERRLSHGGGHTGWSRAWIINFYARLGDGEKAYENLRLLLAKSTLPSLLDNHPPFQIDGNFGGTAGCLEMLLQCRDKTLFLLPALPKAWKTGKLTGARAKWGVGVELSWENEELAKAVLRPDKDVELTISYRGMDKRMILKAGEVFPFGKDLFA